MTTVKMVMFPIMINNNDDEDVDDDAGVDVAFPSQCVGACDDDVIVKYCDHMHYYNNSYDYNNGDDDILLFHVALLSHQ